MKLYHRRRHLLAWAVGGLTFLIFSPAIRFGFLEWDDAATILKNAHVRDLGLENLLWMFTTHYMGPYQPLSWVTLAVDYGLWGLNPQGYHFTNVLLHSLNAVLFCYVSMDLFELRSRAAGFAETAWIPLASVCSALFFSLHPLRVESVAWVTERRDVMSGFFFLLALACYLKTYRQSENSRRTWYLGSLLTFIMAVLSKATAVGLVWVLLAVDRYRLRGCFWLEKIPFFVMGGLLGLLNLWGFATGDLSVGRYGIFERLLLFLYGAVFYALKTLWPMGLSPYYQLPVDLMLIAKPLAAHAIVALLLSVWLFRLRRRWPDGWTAWVTYLLILAPVSGIVQNGQQIAADRYSYLSGMPFAWLAGGGVLLVGQRFEAPMAIRAGLVLAVLWLGGFGWLTRRQLPIWREDRRLWEHAVRVSPESSLAHANLATVLFKRGDDQGAILHYRAALERNPKDPPSHLILGVLYERRGDFGRARRHFESVLKIHPHDGQAQANLALLRVKQGDRERGIRELEGVVRDHPNLAEARFNLGFLQTLQGRWREGLANLRRALALKPELIDRIPADVKRRL